MKKYIFNILLFIVLIACETVVEVDLPKYTPKIVVNGFFSPDTTWQMNLRNSNSILDIQGTDFIDNATVKINSSTDEFELKYRFDLGIYLNRLERPQIGKMYTLHISAPGYEDITSSSYIPEPSQIVSYESSYYNEDYGGGFTETYLELLLTIKDNVNTEDYYLLDLYNKTIYEGKTYLNRQWFTSSAPAIIAENPSDADNVSFSGSSAIFGDALFSGEELKLKLKDIPASRDGTITLALSTIPKELFLYKKNLNRSSDDDVVLFSEPEPHYTNIENGLGIFAGLNTTFVEIE